MKNYEFCDLYKDNPPKNLYKDNPPKTYGISLWCFPRYHTTTLKNERGEVVKETKVRHWDYFNDIPNF